MTRSSPRLPVVAVVGRPNVGKSSLVNRILGRREAIVEQTPGVTRDRTSFKAEWAARSFELVDTGGLEPGQHGLEERVAEQAQLAIDASDLVLFVVDTATGPTQDDFVVADLLRKARKPVVLAANKADDPRDEAAAAAFFRLGLGDPHAVSALHGRGSGDLLDAVVARLPSYSPVVEGPWGSIAIVGRPNVGKSSTLNALVGESRALVDEVPGTTRDPVDSFVALDERRAIRIVDTAGMRRQVRIRDPIEYFSLLRSRGTLDRVDAALLVMDASDGVTGHDQRLTEEIVAAGRACVIAINKWDLVESQGPDRVRFDRLVEQRLRFVPWATVVRTSAKTGRGIGRLLPAIEEAIVAHRTRLPTAEVNRVVRAAQDQRPHPRRAGRATRILYAVQAQTAPPTFVLFATGELDPAYLRYIERQLRDAHPFPGTPLRLQARRRTRPEVEG